MATNTERPRRFDLRTTIPLATETLIYIAKQPKRSWILPALTLITGMAFTAVMLELILSPSSASALGYSGELRSRLSADYAEDPIVARIHELRLAIVEDVLGTDGGDGGDSSAIAVLLKDPVPTATPRSTQIPAKTSVPSATVVASSEPTAVSSATPLPEPSMLPEPSSTPAAPTATAVIGSCDDLSITSMWIESRDEIRARVRNDGQRDAKIVHTLFEWPDVPEPTYVDWFKFDGDKYHDDLDDDQSPTVSSKRSRRIKDGKTETWAVDFDNKPDYGIFGSFTLTLTLEMSDIGTCTLSASTFRAFPTPTPAPTNTPGSTDTPEPTATLTPTNTHTPIPSETAEPTELPLPIETEEATAVPTESSTPDPTTPP